MKVSFKPTRKMFIRHVLSSAKAAGDANHADLQSQLVSLKARLSNNRVVKSNASGYSLNSIYRIIVFLTCDARNNVAFPQLEPVDHGGHRPIRKVDGKFNNA